MSEEQLEAARVLATAPFVIVLIVLALSACFYLFIIERNHRS